MGCRNITHGIAVELGTAERSQSDKKTKNNIKFMGS